MKLLNKTAIITGGCKGIGYATAIKFLKEGANVVIIDLDQEEIEHAVTNLREYSERIEGFAADVTDKKRVETSIQFAIEQFGSLDILINNAGIVQDAQLLKMEEDQWDKVIDVNLKGVFLMTQSAALRMKEQKSGVILNASSVVGLYGNFGQSNYVAAKSGINGMTKTWARELGRYNIRVNSIAPGFVLTDMVKKMPEKVVNMMKEKSLLNEIGKPEDIANAYAFLASEEARFVTGTVLSVDGGLTP
ncbi:3-oxoacyl-[acyl-carrier-protein] reductase FabG [Thalassobacillus devorans]|uniref:3-oxoacyl-[acyl-carrier-protein] reductase FabG n=1 Tax=Thalassobacillus devorans TaxID=279813 RepID=A0ABQ1NGM4_9BACI|nr:3-oxoacyl-ACP reductase FabG [Thalassobacillus devorans]NIK27249.1 3-oxoacyl-[acyl-carrier protein] reductase [Thalassobacillus devorans]GGC76165.1 3-oxoacyl-[acyl-carrier-protein] reductase FabG [Thalassobacillus devorans]